jgi:hypothetical protein
MTLNQPKEVAIKTQSGEERKYILSKFPAIQGREIVMQYPVSAVPRIGDYGVNQETMIKLMAFVAVETANGVLPLTTRALIDNHVPDWETLARLEAAMLEYNCSFFQDGKISSFLENIEAKALALITSTLTALSQQSSVQAKPQSMN